MSSSDFKGSSAKVYEAIAEAFNASDALTDPMDDADYKAIAVDATTRISEILKGIRESAAAKAKSEAEATIAALRAELEAAKASRPASGGAGTKKADKPSKGKEMRLRLADGTAVFKTCGDKIGKKDETSITYLATYHTVAGESFGYLNAVIGDEAAVKFWSPTAWSIAVAEHHAKVTGQYASTKREGYGACYIKPTSGKLAGTKMLLEAVKRLEDDESEPIVKAEMTTELTETYPLNKTPAAYIIASKAKPVAIAEASADSDSDEDDAPAAAPAPAAKPPKATVVVAKTHTAKPSKGRKGGKKLTADEEAELVPRADE
jgi:hypothetical protein